MAAVTRLGLYGGSRGLYGDFSGKTPGAAQISGSTGFTWTPTGNLTATGALAGSTGFQWDITGNLSATLPISGSTGFNWVITGNLSDATVTTAAGGHFLPGLAGVRAGKRKPEDALETAEQVLDEVVTEVLDTPEKPIERVSRRLKTQIIEIATQRLLKERVLIGEIDAIDRAAAKLAKLAIKRRIDARKRLEIVPDDEQELAAFMFRLLSQPDPAKVRDDELILLMQILLML